MKDTGILRGVRVLALSGLICAGSTLLSQAQAPNIVVTGFDTASTVTNWYDLNWAVVDTSGTKAGICTFAWSTNNTLSTLVSNAVDSGAAEIFMNWTNVVQGSGAQDLFMLNFGTNLNFNTDYQAVSFDIMWAPDGATDGHGSYGRLIASVGDNNHDPVAQSGANFIQGYTNNNGWIHVTIPIVPNTAGAKGPNANFNSINGIGFKVQQNKTGYYLVGTSHFYLDNIVIIGRGLPSLAVTPASTLGLRMTPGNTGGTWTRELLATAGTNYSWVGSPTPVTYSTTIASYPGTNYPNFESVIYMVQNGYDGAPGIDYDAPTVVVLSILNKADGTATGTLEYKINTPSDSSFTNPAPLMSITTPTVLGTWSLTFSGDVNVTLTGPGGVSTNASFPDEATAQAFANPMTLYFGDQQNSIANSSALPAVFSGFSVSGLSSTPDSPSFNDTFTGTTINTNLWVLDAPTPGNITLVSAAAGPQYWVSWPAGGAWGLLYSTNPAVAGSFKDAGVVNAETGTTTDGFSSGSVLVPSQAPNVPQASQVYFRLIERIYSKLLVVLPGETFAPGTATGKTGTPTPVPPGTVEPVTVYAVDSTFHLISTIGDAIALTSTDPSGISPLNVQMANGVAIFPAIAGYYLFTSGSQTITAKDFDNNTITSGSSTVLVQ